MFASFIDVFVHLMIILNFSMILTFCCDDQRNGFLLCFNVSKCKVLHIGNASYAGDYRLGHVYLELLDNMHDLGILMD